MNSDDDRREVDLREYLNVLRRRKFTIILVTVVVTLVAIGLSLAQTKVYQGTAQLLLQPRETDTLFDPTTGQRTDAARNVQTQLQVIKSTPVREEVRDTLGSVPGVRANAIGQTDVIQVKGQSTDPKRAAAIANAYANAYIDVRQKQTVSDLLAAAKQIQTEVDDLQKQIDAYSARIDSAAPAQQASIRADVTPRRDSLISQQSVFKQKLDQLQVNTAIRSGGAQLVTPA